MYKDLITITSHNEGADAIKNSIRNILLTPRGTVPGKPRFGSDLHKVLFGQLDTLTQTMARKYIISALSEYETRITVTKTSIVDSKEFNKLVVSIEFTYRDNEFNENIQDDIAISYAL